MQYTVNNETYNVNTVIAFSFYDLALAYETRHNYNLALENYRKSLDYDESLNFIKASINRLLHIINQK
ncbi:MAG: hypothetical protein AB7V50_04850 [Vampirovibrionia bacterium]